MPTAAACTPAWLGVPAGPPPDAMAKGLPVTVWTSPAKVTQAALFGAKGTLAASRVVVKQSP